MKSLLLVLLFSFSIPAWAARHFSDCSIDQKAADQALDRVRGANPTADPACFQTAKEIFLECLGANGSENDCSEAEGAGTSSGLSANYDELTKALLKSHNCSRVKEACFKKKEDDFLRMYSDSCKAPDDPDPMRPKAQLESSAVLVEAQRCMTNQAKEYRREGEKTLVQSAAAKKDGQLAKVTCGNSTKDQIERCYLMGSSGGDDMECITTDQKNTACRPSEGREFTQLDENNPDETKKLPGNVSEMSTGNGKQHCSGGVLGDGTTYFTAGHCGDKSQSRYSARVIDADGQVQQRMMTCGAGINQGTSKDGKLCQLDTPIKAKPVYMMVRDDSVDSCTKTGWEMRCPTSALNSLSNQPAEAGHYPADYPLTRSTGYVRYNSNGTFTHNLTNTGGSSGGNVVINMNGDNVVLGPFTGGDRRTLDSIGYVVSAEDMSQLRIPSLTDRDLRDAEPLMRELELSN